VKKTAEEFSIIDKDLTVEGTLLSTGKLVVRGTVRGRLEGDTVIIAEEGAVYAETKVSSMSIAGVFEGDVKASEELVILSTGKCSGRVICKNLVIEAKGIVNAQVSYISQPVAETRKALSTSVDI
jgi:cytoskeletal protein CcmA (bactofilin family)